MDNYRKALNKMRNKLKSMKFKLLMIKINIINLNNKMIYMVIHYKEQVKFNNLNYSNNNSSKMLYNII